MSEPEFRVGGKQPGNLYRNNQRFGFVLCDDDGPMVAAALNAWPAQLRGKDDVLREQRDAAWARVAELTRDVTEERQHRDFLWWLYAEASHWLNAERNWHCDTIDVRDRLADQVAELTRERDRALAALADLFEGEPCWFDHNGGNHEESHLCPHENAKQVLAGRPAAQEAGHACHDACPCEGNPSYRAHMQHHGVDAECPWCPGPADIAEAAQEAGEPPAPRVWSEGDLVSHRDHPDRRGKVTFTPSDTNSVYVAWGTSLGPSLYTADELTEVLEGGRTDG